MTLRSRSSDAVLVADGVSVGYARRRRTTAVLSDVDVTLREGELACLVGANGAGKSTLLRSLARFQPLLGGEVRIDGASIAALPARDLARRLAVVLTDRISVGQLRAYDLVALGRHPYTDWYGRLRPPDREAIDRALAATGANRYADRPLAELSDGQLQRVILARALAQEPRVLLLDEPTAYLDIRGRLELTTLLTSLTRQHGLAVLMSTHDLEHLLRHADRVWLIDHDRQLRVGAPEDLALDGSLQRTLAETATLDPSTGTFQTRRDSRGTARVIGDGVAYEWTCRALERLGYTIHSSDADIEIRCHDQLGRLAWTLSLDNHDEHLSSLTALSDRLRDHRCVDSGWGKRLPRTEIHAPMEGELR